MSNDHQPSERRCPRKREGEAPAEPHTRPRAPCHYSAGVASHSPGLPANAGYPGMPGTPALDPAGVAAFENRRDDGTPLGYGDWPVLNPRVAAKRGNPGLCDRTPSEYEHARKPNQPSCAPLSLSCRGVVK
jgi:hypothetical protein